jgi:lysophospholipase L1-like esterase
LIIGACQQEHGPEGSLVHADAAPITTAAHHASQTGATLDGALASSSAIDVPMRDAPTSDAATPKIHCVLEIGDSMVGYASGLAKVLRARLTAEGIEFHSDAVTSASVASFDSSDKLDRLMKLFNPDLVILNLGTNSVSVPNPEILAPHAASLVKKILPRRCLWLGPPSLHEKPPAKPSPLVQVLRDASSPCLFFDSSALLLERQPDGIHPTERGAMVWEKAFAPLLDPLLVAGPGQAALSPFVDAGNP